METLVDWGVAQHPLRGQTVSGDFYVVQSSENGFLISVIDGLGHGPHAAAAAKTAASVLRANAHESVAQLFNLCHRELRQTRGVAISLASFDKQLKSLCWFGVGNVEGVLLRPGGHGKLSSESIPLRGGVVGYQLPPLRPAISSVRSGETIIFATDGIRSGFVQGLSPRHLSMKAEQLADCILYEYDKGTDDSLVLVARCLGDDS
jgi:serine phosphatase RsbU (regulator of sigma subunit)